MNSTNNAIKTAGEALTTMARKGDRTLLPRAPVAMVKGVMSLYGLDLRKVTLTGRGLR